MFDGAALAGCLFGPFNAHLELLSDALGAAFHMTTGISGNGSRTLRLISPLGTRNTHGGGAEFGSGDGVLKSEGYFVQEVSDPKLAGFDDEKYLGNNALDPEFELVTYYH